MKTMLVVLMLVMMCGCTQQTDPPVWAESTDVLPEQSSETTGSVSAESTDVLPEQSSETAEPVSEESADVLPEQSSETTEPVSEESTDVLPEQSSETAEPSTEIDPVFLKNEPYSFSEVDPLFGPGPFSVNDLAETFGEPEFIGAYYVGEDDYYVEGEDEDGYFEMWVQFKDITVSFRDKSRDQFHFILQDDPNPDVAYGVYEATDADREVRLKPQSITVFGKNWPLPRNLKIGDSINTLYEAYDGNKGRERTAQGQFMISYDYEEDGRITYLFNTDVIDENLYITAFSIEWYDVWRWEEMSFPEGLPPA